MKRFLVVVHLADKSTRVSHVVGTLGAALRTADAFPTRPSVVLSGTTNMLMHAREALTIPSQTWLRTQTFLAHVYSTAALFNFKTEMVQNAAMWDIRRAQVN
jgi:hypothetical protein